MKDNNKRKIITSIFVTLLIVLGVSSATYAVYKWRSSVHLNVDIDVTSDIIIKFDGGPDITERIYPVSNYTKGAKKTFTIKSNLPNGGSTFNLYLKINDLPEELEDVSFKMMITSKSDDYEYASLGIYNFSDSDTDDDDSIDNKFDDDTDDYLLLENVEIPYIQPEEYEIYFWLDGENYTQDPSIGGKEISFSLYATKCNSDRDLILEEVDYE